MGGGEGVLNSISPVCGARGFFVWLVKRGNAKGERRERGKRAKGGLKREGEGGRRERKLFLLKRGSRAGFSSSSGSSSLLSTFFPFRLPPPLSHPPLAARWFSPPPPPPDKVARPRANAAKQADPMKVGQQGWGGSIRVGQGRQSLVFPPPPGGEGEGSCEAEEPPPSKRRRGVLPWARVALQLARNAFPVISNPREREKKRSRERERERKVEGTLAREKEQAERRGVLFERSREGGGSNVDAADARVEEGVCDKKKFRFSIFSSFLLFVPVRDVFSLSKLQRRDGKLSSRVGGAACRRALCGGRRVWFNTIGNRALESERERPDLKKKNRFISFSSFFA